MPPRALASLAHALTTAPDLDAALVALAEGVSELDRLAEVALVTYDARRGLMSGRRVALPGGRDSAPIDATLGADELRGVTGARELIRDGNGRDHVSACSSSCHNENHPACSETFIRTPNSASVTSRELPP